MTPEEQELIDLARQIEDQPSENQLFPQPYKNIRRLLYLELAVSLEARDLVDVQFAGWDPVKAYILCNDTFYWASADAEEIEMKDFNRLEELLKRGDKELEEDGKCAYRGRLVWLCEKRQMRPIKPIFDSLTGWAREEIQQWPERQHHMDECWVPGCGLKHEPPTDHEEL
jgi:hypothetical protein